MKVKPRLATQIACLVRAKFVRSFYKGGATAQGPGCIEIIFVGSDKHHVLWINLK